MLDLISIGDSVVDTYIPLEEATQTEVNGVEMLAVRAGSKVPVGISQSMVGGNAANNAVGAARLNLKTAIYTNVGNKDDDQYDDRIKEKLKKEGVDIRYVVESPDLASNHNVILSYKGQRTILIHHQEWQFQLPDLEQTKWIYLTSMAPSYVKTNVIDQLVNYIERNRAKLVYQPGTFQLRQGKQKNARLLSLAQLVVMNKEEATEFLGYQAGEEIDIKRLLTELVNLGSHSVIITDGANGSYGVSHDQYWHLSTFPTELVEVTGAGDAYATGVTASLIYGNDLAEAMRWGAANSASVVQQFGAQAGLLNYDQIQKVLSENKKLKPTEI